MKDTLLKMLHSKKIWVLIIGILVVVLNRVLELGLTGDDLQMIAGADIAALLGIGFADWGKEGAAVLADAAKLRNGVPVEDDADPT